jgi:hypothetical protein
VFTYNRRDLTDLGRSTAVLAIGQRTTSDLHGTARGVAWRFFATATERDAVPWSDG